MQISERLRTIASFVSKGSRVADIGTDHAYVPIYLISEGKAAHVLAMDVREGPLARAREHIRERRLCNDIEVRQSDGFFAYREGEADSIVISGMGGALMERILSEGIGKCKSVKEWILSPQSELFLVRRWLRENSLKIEQETMICEDGKYYTVMRAVPGESGNAAPVEDIYGKYLLEHRNPMLKAYLLHEKENIEKILTSLDNGRQQAAIQHRLLLVKEALGYYEM